MEPEELAIGHCDRGFSLFSAAFKQVLNSQFLFAFAYFACIPVGLN
jgi:hypothetical protein